MTFYVENETNYKFSFSEEEIANKVIQESIDYVKCPYECEVELIITDNKNIQEMNREFRKIDRATDVLSFPNLTYIQPADFDFLEEDNCTADFFHPESGELLLGNIIISYEKVIEQAKEFGHSEAREFAFLIAHSMLHLFGYDHIAEEEMKEMETSQEKILNNLGIKRE